MLEGLLPSGHPAGVLRLPSLPSPARPSCCLCPSLGETVAWPLLMPKGLTLLELHVKWSESDKQWLQLQRPKEGVGSY